MPNAPDDPSLRPWRPRQPVEAERLDRWQGRTVMDVTVTGRGVKTYRKGNSVAVHLPRQRPTPRGNVTFPVGILTPAIPGGLYLGYWLDESQGAGISLSQTTIQLTDIGAASSENIYIVNLTELGRTTHDLVAATNVPAFAAWWWKKRMPDGTRVALTWGLQWANCGQGLSSGDLKFV